MGSGGAEDEGGVVVVVGLAGDGAEGILKP